MIEITNEDLNFFKTIHPEKSSITPEYREKLFLGLKNHIKINYHTSNLPAKEFYDRLTSDFKRIEPTEQMEKAALKVLAIQVAIAGRVKNNFLRVQEKDCINLGLYTETGRKGDLYYALATTVEYCIDKLKVIPGIVQWIHNSGFDLPHEQWKLVVPRSHVLEENQGMKTQRKSDIEALLKALTNKADLTKINFHALKIVKI
jgi:hypothetical protein